MAETDTKSMTTTEDIVRETLRAEVYDPELGLNIIDLGLVYDITAADNKADITMTLTSPACPLGPELITNIRRRNQLACPARPGFSDQHHLRILKIRLGEIHELFPFLSRRHAGHNHVHFAGLQSRNERHELHIREFNRSVEF